MRGFKTFEHFLETFTPSGSVKKILITGSSGRLGNELFHGMKRVYGAENILCVDLKNDRNIPDERYERLNVLDGKRFEDIVKNF